jgi:hypothetical protein
MKHILVSRINFNNLELLKDYLKITKEILIPCLKSQTQKNFTWLIITNPENINLLEKEIDFPFLPIFGNHKFIDYVIENEINIQTRHDCDDYMSSTYIEKIQNLYFENIKKYESFIIHTQPTKLNYSTKIEEKLSNYHEERCSMFLSLCQKNVKNHVLERKHGQMYEITKNIIKLPEGYTKWIIHGKNKSLKNNK